MSNARYRTALLGSGAAIAMMAAAVPASAGEIDTLRSQIEALQTKLATLETNQSALEQQYNAAPANAVVGGDKPGSFRLPGSNTSVAIGGYAKLDLIYDFDEQRGDSWSVGSIALDGTNPENQDGNFRMHARQSRLWVRTWTPTDWGEFSTHIEGDFMSPASEMAGNQIVTNSAGFRLRHAYGQLGNVLAGQTWSNFNMPWAWAGTIDFAGSVGTSFIRQAQLRYTAPLGDGLSLAVALENPETTINTPGLGMGMLQAPSIGTGANVGEQIPDVTARLQYDASWGTVGVAGLFRHLTQYNATNTADDSEIGWAAHAAAVFKLWGKDSVGIDVGYGQGAGKYFLWGAGSGAIGTLAPTLATVESWGGTVWLEHWWTDNLYSVAAFGYGDMDWSSVPFAMAGTANDELYTGHVNLQWQPVSRASIGVEYIWGHRETLGGADGTAQRVQVGFTWGFST